MDRKKELLWRAYIVMFGFVLATLVILYKVFNISVIESKKWRQKGEVNVQWRKVDADRGNIYAEEENLLATSLQFFEVRMDMKPIRKEDFDSGVDSLAYFLSNFDEKFIKKRTHQEWKKILMKARKKKSSHLFIGKGFDIEAFNKLKKAPIFRLGKIRNGMAVNRYGKRIKPYKELASRTIGVDRENADKVGLEGYFERFLRGETDLRLMKRLSAGDNNWVPVYDPSENEIKRGDDVYTTINVDMQDIVHHELMAACKQHNAESGCAVVMETSTGAIKAISNLSRIEADSNYYEMYNLAASRLSEPGSTIKLATMLALMEDGVNDPNKLVNLNLGVRQFSDRTMHDSERHGKMTATMQECFEISSNVGVAALANDRYNNTEGRKLWVKRLRQFGLAEPTGLDLIGEAVPEIKDPVKNKEKWYGTTIPWMAHGYELMMTPLQILNFFNTVANDGKMMRPYLVSEIRKGDEVKKKFDPVVVRDSIARLVSIQKVKKMMEGVILNGTGKSMKSDFVTMAGKTGTAKTNYAQTGQVAEYNGSFCGYFPAENPMYTMIVVIYRPKMGVFYGGATAGPVFKNVAEKIYAMKTKQVKTLNDSIAMASHKPGPSYGYAQDFEEIYSFLGMKEQDVQKPNTWALVGSKNDKVAFKKKNISGKTVPDVNGMGARDAMYLLENQGLKVKLKGLGRVVSQSITAGTAAKGQTIILNLN